MDENIKKENTYLENLKGEQQTLVGQIQNLKNKEVHVEHELSARKEKRNESAQKAR